jgi:hypothetical protein
MGFLVFKNTIWQPRFTIKKHIREGYFKTLRHIQVDSLPVLHAG